MIAVSKFSEYARVLPVEVAVGLTAADLAALRTGRRLALPGRPLGFAGTDFLFLACPKGPDQAENDLKYLLEQFAPEAPAGHRFGVAAVAGQFWQLPVSWGTSRIAQITALSNKGLRELAGGDTLQYRARLFGPEELDLPAGVSPLAAAEGAIQNVFKRGGGIQPGSVALYLRAMDDGDRAAKWARRKLGLRTDGRPAADQESHEYHLDDPAAWLPHWPVTPVALT